MDGLKTDVSMNFSGNTLSLDGYVLGPGLALYMFSIGNSPHILFIKLKRRAKGLLSKTISFNALII